MTEALAARQPPGMPKQDQSAQLHMPWQMVHDVKLARAAGVTLFSFSPNWPIQSRRAHTRVRTALQHEGIDALESTKDTKGKSHGPGSVRLLLLL